MNKFRANKEYIQNEVAKMLADIRVDVDLEYCHEQSAKFNNHEKDVSEIDLFTSDSNKAAFNRIFSLSK